MKFDGLKAKINNIKNGRFYNICYHTKRHKKREREKSRSLL